MTTDPRHGVSGWRTAAVVAPAAAAAFAFATGWAMEHPPESSAATDTSTQAAPAGEKPAADPKADQALRRRAAAAQERVARLKATLARLEERHASVKESTASATSRGSVSRSPDNAAAAVPEPPSAPAPAPAPAADTSTGAS